MNTWSLLNRFDFYGLYELLRLKKLKMYIILHFMPPQKIISTQVNSVFWLFSQKNFQASFSFFQRYLCVTKLNAGSCATFQNSNLIGSQLFTFRDHDYLETRQ